MADPAIPPSSPPAPPAVDPLWSWPFPPADWEKTPPSVQAAFLARAPSFSQDAVTARDRR